VKAVKRRERKEIKNSQGNVEVNKKVEKIEIEAADVDEKAGGAGKNEITGRARKGDNQLVASGVGKIVGVNGHGFTPAETDKEKHEGAQRIKMGEGV